ncbi:Dps family protein [Cohnella lubricantis]|uniref:DNA starvation/stationary phase protection protein n=1 Tax=Cohnella lubricantis TaxID=2163172 RepID=A0A841T997_9BACL|nr:Dps family protein [Cohnella lubricantis]MBB6676639.1 DNA starvation/stationary phase protection protein [Cohnella lubricantis]MBP2117350.1 starvation-inducible DNA-binding protein [Cohnella lubricantis]
MNAMTTELNKQLANWIVTEMKLRNFHWHIKGPHFFTLHAKFEELYNEAADHIDVLAERLRALGEDAVTTLSEVLKLATVQEDACNRTSEQMVETIAHDFGLMIDELQTALALTESVGDEVTHDMLLEIQAGLQKHVWMLNAFASK